MYVKGKVWGTTSPLIISSLVEIHKVHANAGTFCSKHSHARKWNAFAVIEGRLKINIWASDYDLVDVTVLSPGDITTVKPGEVHQFEVPDDADCTFLEIYYLEGLGPDIDRLTYGGTKDTALPLKG